MSNADKVQAAQIFGLKIITEYSLEGENLLTTITMKKGNTIVDTFVETRDKTTFLNFLIERKKSLEMGLNNVDAEIATIEALHK